MAVDVVVAPASARSYAAQTAKTAGWTPARAEQTKRTTFRKDVNVNVHVSNVPDHATFRFVPFAVETCGYMGKEAVTFVIRLEYFAARLRVGAFARENFCTGQCSCCR